MLGGRIQSDAGRLRLRLLLTDVLYIACRPREVGGLGVSGLWLVFCLAMARIAAQPP